MKSKQSGRIASGYRVGPGMTSLLLIFVALCMAALAVLSFASVQVEATLNERAAAAARRYYDAAAQAQEKLFELDQQLLAEHHAAPVAEQAGENTAVVTDQPSPLPEAQPEQMTYAVPLGDGRELVVVLEIPGVPTGSRYVVRSHRVANTAEWEAEQNIGVYAPPAAD